MNYVTWVLTAAYFFPEMSGMWYFVLQFFWSSAHFSWPDLNISIDFA